MTSYPPPPGANPPPPPGTPAQQPYGAPAQQPYGAEQQPYGAPAAQPYGAQQQPYGAPAAPPALPVLTQTVKAPAVAWLVPAAALLAVIGMFTPWFKAKATRSGGGRATAHDTADALYSIKDGRIGLLAPILLVLIAAGVVGLLMGRTPARFRRGDAHPVATAGKGSLIVGGVTLGCVLIAWFLVKSQYKFPGPDGGKDYSWDGYIKLFKDNGYKLELSRGPQIGYFLTIAAGLLAIVAGILMIMAARNSSAKPAPSGYPPAGGNYGAAPGGYAPAPPGYAPPQGGYPQPGPPAPAAYPQSGPPAPAAYPQSGPPAPAAYPQSGPPAAYPQSGPPAPQGPPPSH